MNGKALKEANSFLVLRELLSGSSSSRIEVARKTGLSKMTVTNVVARLIEMRFLVEESKGEIDGKGRPAISLSLSPNAPKALAVFLSPEVIRIRLVTLDLKTILQGSWEINKDNVKDFEKILLNGIDETIRKAINTPIVGMGFSIEGDFDEQTGTLKDKDCYYGREEIPLLSIVRSHYELPIVFSRSSDCLAMAESFFGVGKEEKEILFLHLGKHLESSIIHEGEILKIASGNCCDIGHVSIDYNGLSCSCGNRGCLETYVASDVVEKKLREITKMRVDFKGFCELQTKKNDSRIDWAFKDMMDKMAAALTGYCSLLHPSLIVLGGDGYYLPDRYLAKLEKTLNEKTAKFNRGEIRVQKPKFKNEASETGSVLPLVSQVLLQA